MTVPVQAVIERLAYSPAEAAAAIGVGETLFRTEFMPYLRVIRVGKKTLVPVDELRRLLSDRAEQAIANQIAQ